MNFEEANRTWSYEPDTGILRWKIKPAYRVLVGDVAGCKKSNKGGYSYMSISFKGKQYKAHKIAWLIFYGVPPKHQIDHEDGNSVNNRIENLRDVTQIENGRNQKLSTRNTSGFCGVRWQKKMKAWVATIVINGKPIYLGRFYEKNDAIITRQIAQEKFGFHKNHGLKR